MSKPRKYPICLFDDCEREQAARGLCLNHIRQAARFVKDGKITWSELEENKKTLPTKKSGRKTGKFQEWLLVKTAEAT